MLSKAAFAVAAQVPGTVLANLLRNSAVIFEDEGTDVYVDDRLSQVPDISETGRDFWTYWYVAVWNNPYMEGPAMRQQQGGSGLNSSALSRVSLNLRAINYRARVFLNGELATDLMSGDTKVEGMFRRSRYLMPSERAAGVSSGTVIAVLVEPPDYPGKPGGQGGDHEIAKQTTSQFSAGWDWIQATPDRNTGLWDRVFLSYSGVIELLDPWIHTVSLSAEASSAEIEVAFTVKNWASCSTRLEIDVSLWFEEKQVNKNIEESLVLAPGEEREISFHVKLEGVHLWWPHTLGIPAMYSAFIVAKDGDGKLSDCAHVPFGVRTVSSFISDSTHGRVFVVNERKVFIEGGNWIQTDQLLQYAGDADRYYNEVRLHKEMGMNFIRVWGGGTAERPEFYEACDRLGVLVMQEFWMTGDNNGRWAGSYSWPLNHTEYILCAQDTVRLLRRHPSLLFWCAGNELEPIEHNPPPDIGAAITYMLDTLDGSRPYLRSSMTSPEDFTATTALCPQDGPYGLLEQDDFSYRNPGLRFENGTRREDLLISFQPELGSVSMPTYLSLSRFLTGQNLAQFPQEGLVNPVWDFHKLIGFSDDTNVSQIELYGIPNSTAEFVLRAQLVQYAQYKLLFESFQARMWSWYSAIVMWKSQSPWPALRGALYDYYLAQTGGFWGIRSALRQICVQLDLGSQVVYVVNKEKTAVLAGGEVTSCFYNLGGERVQCQTLVVLGELAGESAAPVGSVVWPKGVASNATLIVRMRLVDSAGGELAINEYWQSNFTRPQQYSELAALRHDTPQVRMDSKPNGRAGASSLTLWARPQVTLVGDANYCRAGNQLFVSLQLDNRSSWVAFGIMVTLFSSQGREAEDRMLPVYYSDNLFSILPSEQRRVELQYDCLRGSHPCPDVSEGVVVLLVEGWNVATTHEVATAHC
eukprot:scaffold1275_cov401-Prasinococcus_capsulatus_cf.AAC.7